MKTFPSKRKTHKIQFVKALPRLTDGLQQIPARTVLIFRNWIKRLCEALGGDLGRWKYNRASCVAKYLERRKGKVFFLNSFGFSQSTVNVSWQLQLKQTVRFSAAKSWDESIFGGNSRTEREPTSLKTSLIPSQTERENFSSLLSKRGRNKRRFRGGKFNFEITLIDVLSCEIKLPNVTRIYEIQKMRIPFRSVNFYSEKRARFTAVCRNFPEKEWKNTQLVCKFLTLRHSSEKANTISSGIP